MSSSLFPQADACTCLHFRALLICFMCPAVGPVPLPESIVDTQPETPTPILSTAQNEKGIYVVGTSRRRDFRCQHTISGRMRK